MKIKKAVLILCLMLPLAGCNRPDYLSAMDKGVTSNDPVERGCSYIAGAIVLAAVMRAIFNK